jgi:diguanylate cyclase (GGDEF)-like protein
LFLIQSLLVVTALLAAWHLGHRAADEVALAAARDELEMDARTALLLLEGPMLRGDPVEVDALCKKLGATMSTRLTCVLTTGVVVGDSEVDPASMENHRERPEIQEALAGRVGTAVRFSGTRRTETLYVALPVGVNHVISGVVRTSRPVERVVSAIEAFLVQMLWGGLGLVLVMGLISLVLARRLSKPLGDLFEGIRQVGSGNLSHRVPVPGTGDMRVLAQELNRAAAQFEQRDREERIFSEMRELLLACSTTDEVPPIAASTLRRLFPWANGALYLLSASRNDLETAARWGDWPEDPADTGFAPDDCWALRRARSYLVENVEDGLLCPHVRTPPARFSLCIPLVAKGDVLGTLHLRNRETCSESEGAETLGNLRRLAGPVAEHLALSLANARLRQALASQSVRDPLTGLFNRRYLEETLQREIARAGRQGASIGVVMADIDHFKHFNDTWGHEAGDRVLNEVAQLLKSGVRTGDIASRYGGEEFTLVLIGSSLEDAAARADKIREHIQSLVVPYRDRELGPVTLSLGVACFPAHGVTVADLLRTADGALYRAKSEGRNRVIAA